MFVYKTYALEREADAELSLGDIWNLFQEDALPNNNFCRQMINCMKAWNQLQKTSDLLLNNKMIMQTHRMMMEDENDVLAGGYRESHLCLQVIIFLHQLVILKDTWKEQFLDFMKIKKVI